MNRLHLVFRDTDPPLSEQDRIAAWNAKRAYIPELRSVSAFSTPLERALHGLRVAVDGFQMPEWCDET